MGESRKKRTARLAEIEATALGPLAPERGRREKGSQRAGETLRSGHPATAAVLEDALLCRGRVERVTHGFHTYPAGLHPDAAARLLTLGEGPVLDPFCGGGTVLVESLLAGRDALGLDVGSVACIVSRARTWRSSEADRTAMRSGARRAAAAGMAASGHPVDPAAWPIEIARAYEPHVLAELAALREAIGNDDHLRAVFSAILVKASRRASDTSNRLEEAHRAPGTTSTLFHAKAREYARMLEELATASPAGTARVHREDAREFRAKHPFGMVVTSPPYPGVYDYLPMQALRRFWLGLDDERAFREEIGARRNFRADRASAIEDWKEDTRLWVRAAAKALAVGGKLIVVVGDGQVGTRHIDAWTPLDAAAREAGLRFHARATAERWDEGLRTMRPEHAGVWVKEPPASAG